MPNLSELQGTPWHVETLHMKEGDTRRSKFRCIYYRSSDNYCLHHEYNCFGSSHCDKYHEKPIVSTVALRDEPLHTIYNTSPGQEQKEFCPYVIGARVTSDSFGKGKLTKKDLGRVWIRFESGEEKLFSYPMAIEKNTIRISGDKEKIPELKKISKQEKDSDSEKRPQKRKNSLPEKNSLALDSSSLKEMKNEKLIKAYPAEIDASFSKSHEFAGNSSRRVVKSDSYIENHVERYENLECIQETTTTSKRVIQTLQSGEVQVTKTETVKKKTTSKQVAENQGCYIASCVYGSYDCSEVWVLRRFRDYCLSSFFLGRVFIKSYYAISPKLVKSFGKKKWFVCFWKSLLDSIINMLMKQGYEDTPYHDVDRS